MLDNINDLEIDNVDNLEQDIFNDSDKDLEVNFEGEKVEADDYMLSLGKALNEKELYRLSSKVPMRIIYVLGPVRSGKTTFESMLYAFFLKNICCSCKFKAFKSCLLNASTNSKYPNFIVIILSAASL